MTPQEAKGIEKMDAMIRTWSVPVREPVKRFYPNDFPDALKYNYAIQSTGDEDIFRLVAPDKPKLGKLLAYLTPLLLILGVARNPEMGRRELFKPWRWFSGGG